MIAAGCLTWSAAASGAPRTVINLQDGWLFKEGTAPADVRAATFDDAKWTKVSVPHTWNRLGNAGLTRAPESNSFQGEGWYRLRFPTPASFAGNRAFLQFDGVGAVADAWVNGQHVGHHEGAFSRFRFDVTAALRPQGENLLVVKADNSKPAPGSTTAHVIPLSGDFFIFGGLYRQVSLIIARPVHLDLADFGGPGVYGRVTSVSDEQATVSIASRVTNAGLNAVPIIVASRIEDAAGRAVATEERRVQVTKSATMDVDSTLRIDRPRRWRGVADPYVYRLVIALRTPQGEVLDEVSQPLGVRTMTFDADKGFFLNGEHLMLVGASMHQDRPVKGWALAPADRVQDFDLLQEMGGNAVRFAHYQHDQTPYELADARGIVAWAEIPLVNEVSFDGSPASDALAANAHQQLTELIKQTYNHPSIAVWSIGNEVDLRPTSTDKPGRAGALMQSLNALAKKLDPGRLTTHADCCEQREGTQRKPRDQLVGITETQGYNRYFGWYSGKFADLGPNLDEAHARHARLPISVSEYGAGSALSQHSDNALGGPINSHGRPHPEEYQLLYHEEAWRQLRERNYVWGAFIWNMFDFASNSRSEGDLTDVNEKGMVSYDRSVRKDVFYFYKANWNRAPTLHLVGRRYIDRAYGVVDVKAYSNAKEARLTVNGNDLGTAPCNGGICVWRGVHLARGLNQVAATSEHSGATLTDSVQWMYSGSPSELRIKAGDLLGYVAADSTRFGSDNFFTGGDGFNVESPDLPAERRTVIAGTSVPALYGTYRAGAFAYDLPLPDGKYVVTAHFVEPTESSAGARVFDVAANGRVALAGIDPFALAGGKMKAAQRSFAATATGGHLHIEFRPRQGKPALVSALEVVPEGRAAPSTKH
jgi:beta-galactosidase